MPFFKMQNGVKLKLVPGRYPNNNCLGFYLICEKIPAELQDEFFPGEPWARLTVNLPGLQPDEFALNHDFSGEDLFVLKPVMEHLTGEPFPQTPCRYIHSGYVDFPVFKYSDRYKKLACNY